MHERRARHDTADDQQEVADSEVGDLAQFRLQFEQMDQGDAAQGDDGGSGAGNFE